MKKLLHLLSLMLSACLISAATFTNIASVDSFVRAAAPTSNYGAAGALSVSGANALNGSGVANGAFDSFIRFNTDAMVTIFNTQYTVKNWTITAVRLRVTEMGAPANALFNRGKGAFEIRWIANDNWTEGTGIPTAPSTLGIIYNDKTTLLSGATVALGSFTNTVTDATLTFPLALPPSFLADLYAGSDVGLYLTAIDPEIGFTFDSRSFGTASARPVLEITVLPKPTITSIAISTPDIQIAANNGATNITYLVLTAPDLTTPINQWEPLSTNTLSSNGNFSLTLTNAANLASPSSQFFLLQAQ